MTRKIIRPSTLEWPGEWDISVLGMSQSLWNEWLHCRRSFLFILNGYSLPQKEEKTNFGSICHDVTDKVYTRGEYPTSKQINTCIDSYCEKRIKDGTVVTQKQIEQDAAKSEATLTEYFKYYKKDFDTKKFFNIEHKFNTRYNGCIQRGKIDGAYITNRKKWLMEHKTKGQINEDSMILYLNLDFQNLFYLLNDEIETGKLAVGMMYNIIRNSQIKILKNETLRDYKNKITKAIKENPEHHFKRWEAVYTEDERDTFCTNLDRMISDIKAETSLPVYPSTCHCLKPWQCQFLKACSSDSMRSLVKSEEPLEDRLFSELKEDANAGEKSRKRATRRKIAKRIKRKKT